MEVATLLGEHNKRNLLEIYKFCCFFMTQQFIYLEKKKITSMIILIEVSPC